MEKKVIFATAFKRDGDKVESQSLTREIEIYTVNDKMTAEVVRLANSKLVVEQQNDMRNKAEVSLGWKVATPGGKGRATPKDALKV